MSGRRRTALGREAELRNREQLARLGSAVRRARLARRLTQARLAERTGLGRMSVSRAERGLGGGLTVDAWQRLGLALGMPLAVNLQRDPQADTADAGHLAMQELVLRTGQAAGYRGLVELPTRPAEPWRSIDVALMDDGCRRLVVVECWNKIGDIGAAVRASTRKQAEAGELATAGGVRIPTAWVCAGSSGRRRATGPSWPAIRRCSGPLPGQQRRMGQGAHGGRGTAARAGAGLVERRWLAPLRMAPAVTGCPTEAADSPVLHSRPHGDDREE